MAEGKQRYGTGPQDITTKRRDKMVEGKVDPRDIKRIASMLNEDIRDNNGMSANEQHLPIEVVNVLDQIKQPIKASELLDWTYDNLDADLASEYQREIYEYLLHSGKISADTSVSEPGAIAMDGRNQSRQIISVEASYDESSYDEANQYVAHAFASPEDPIYAACPVQYGSTEDEAVGKVKEWLVNNGADISRLEVNIH